MIRHVICCPAMMLAIASSAACSLHTMTREKKENTSDLTQWLKNVLERLQKTDPKGFDKLVTAAA